MLELELVVHVIEEFLLLYDAPDWDCYLDPLVVRQSSNLVVYCKRKGLRAETYRNSMLGVEVIACIIVESIRANQMTAQNFRVTPQQSMEKSKESSTRSCPPGALEEDCVVLLDVSPNQLQMLEPSISPPSRLNLHACYTIYSKVAMHIEAVH